MTERSETPERIWIDFDAEPPHVSVFGDDYAKQGLPEYVPATRLAEAEARERKLREALTKIADDRVPMYRTEGRPNKCIHRRTADEDCKWCTQKFARAALTDTASAGKTARRAAVEEIGHIAEELDAADDAGDVQRCAECDCENGGDDCNWIAAAREDPFYASDRRAREWSERLSRECREDDAPTVEAGRDLGTALRELSDNWTRAPYLSGWKHIKSGGEYAVKMHVLLEATLEPAVIYWRRYADPIETWCRPASEFFDGRFVSQQEGGE